MLLVNEQYCGDSNNFYYVLSLESIMLDNSNITHWIAGHTHCGADVTIGDCRCIVNPYGYGGIIEISIEMLVLLLDIVEDVLYTSICSMIWRE